MCKSDCPNQKIIFTEGPRGPPGPSGFEEDVLLYNNINVYSSTTELTDTDHTVFLDGLKPFSVKLPKLNNNEENGNVRKYRTIKIKSLNKIPYTITASEDDTIYSTKSMRLTAGKSITLYGCNNKWIYIM